LGCVADGDDIDDKHCYVPSDVVAIVGPPVTLESLKAQIKFGSLANIEIQNNLILKLLKDPAILQSHETARVRNFEYRIFLDTTEPIIDAKRQAPAEIRFLQDEVAARMKEGIIGETDPGRAPYVSHPLVVPKKGSDGKYTEKRFCIDYRKINKHTIKDKYNLPTLETCLHMREAYVFSKIDLKAAFWQIPIHKNDQIKTGFQVDNKVYYFKVMPFGMSNAPACMQRLIDKVLVGIKGAWAFGYLDDIIVFSKNIQEHAQHIFEIFDRIKNFGLRISLSKCEFFQEKILFLGHVISHGAVEIDPDKIKAIKDLPPPTDVKKLQSFLGMAGWCRRFIYSYALVTSPLTDLLRKNQPWIWGPAQERAFNNVKDTIMSGPILIQSNWSKPFNLETDASNYGIGAVLFQEQEGMTHPISFISRKLTSTEINYSTREKEFLAILWGCERLKTYLWGRRFTVYTDHKNLTWIRNGTDDNSRLSRWVRKLSVFSFDLKFSPGIKNVWADCLSRNPVHLVAVRKRHSVLVVTRSGYKQGLTEQKIVEGKERTRQRTERKTEVKDRDAEMKVAPAPTPISSSSSSSLSPSIPIPTRPISTPTPTPTPIPTSITSIPTSIPTTTPTAIPTAPTLAPTSTPTPVPQVTPLSPLLPLSPTRSREISAGPSQRKRPKVSLSVGQPAEVDDYTQTPFLPFLERKFLKEIDDSPYPLPDIETWKRALKQDPEYEALIRELDHKEEVLGPPPDLHTREKLKKLVGFFKYQHGFLYFKKSDADGTDILLLEVPLIFRRPLISAHHDTVTAGHRGKLGTIKAIQKYYHWFSITYDVEKYVNDCLTCFLTKTPNPRNQGLMGSMNVEVLKFQVIHLDFVGPLPPTLNDNRHILSIRDRGSGMYWGTPSKTPTALETAKILWSTWIARYGVPIQIITDQGSAFVSELFANLTKLMGIKVAHTTSYHPQSNGLVERDHRTLKAYLKAFCFKNPTTWDDFLPGFNFVINNTPRWQTNYTPNFILYGLNPRPPTLLFDRVLTVFETDDYVAQMLAKLDTIHRELVGLRKKQQEDNKSLYDVHHRYVDFALGDIVYRRADKIPKGTVRKFWLPWKGPFTIVKIDEGKINVIIRSEDGDEETVHVSKIATFKKQQTRDPETLFREFLGGRDEDFEIKESPPLAEAGAQISAPIPAPHPPTPVQKRKTHQKVKIPELDEFVIIKRGDKNYLFKIIAVKPLTGWMYRPISPLDSGASRMYKPVFYDTKAKLYDYTTKKKENYIEVTEELSPESIIFKFGNLDKFRMPESAFDEFCRRHETTPYISHLME